MERPTLETNLLADHDSDCLGMQLAYYPDLNEIIMATLDQVGESVYDYMQVDFDVMASIDSDYLSQIRGSITYRDLLVILMKIQEMLRCSTLDDRQKQDFFSPIAETFVRVKEALKERFVSLEDREILVKGDTFYVKTIFFARSKSGAGIGSAFAFPSYNYAGMEPDEDDRYRKVPLKEVFFPDAYLETLPAGVKRRLHNSGKINLPVRLVTRDQMGRNLVVIDFEELGWEV